MAPSGRRPSDQAKRPGLSVRPVGCQKPHPPSPFIITQPESWHSFYHPVEGRRLSRPRQCSKGVQPVPKAVYHLTSQFFQVTPDYSTFSSWQLDLNTEHTADVFCVTQPIASKHWRVKTLTQKDLKWYITNLLFLRHSWLWLWSVDCQSDNLETDQCPSPDPNYPYSDVWISDYH